MNNQDKTKLSIPIACGCVERWEQKHGCGAAGEGYGDPNGNKKEFCSDLCFQEAVDGHDDFWEGVYFFSRAPFSEQ